MVQEARIHQGVELGTLTQEERELEIKIRTDGEDLVEIKIREWLQMPRVKMIMSL